MRWRISISLICLSTVHSRYSKKGSLLDGEVEPLMPDMVEDSSDDEDDGEGPRGDDDRWGP